jgi:hypothetical protein
MPAHSGPITHKNWPKFLALKILNFHLLKYL